MEILSVIESRFTSGVVQAKVFLFKINLLFSGFKCFRASCRDLSVLIVKVVLKKGLKICEEEVIEGSKGTHELKGKLEQQMQETRTVTGA